MDEYKDGYYHKPNPLSARRPQSPGEILKKELASRGLDDEKLVCLTLARMAIMGSFWIVAQFNYDVWPMRNREAKS